MALSLRCSFTICCTAVLGLSLSAVALAQSDEAAGEPAPRERDMADGRNGVKEVGPEIYYLKDDEGNLRPAPKAQLEKFLQWQDTQAGIENPPPPPYQLERSEFEGRLVGDRAEFQARFTIVKQNGDESWARIPLQLSNAVLRESARHTGPGRQFLVFDEEDGYVCWIRAPADSRHTVELELSAAVEHIGGSAKLSLSFPRATTGQLRLQTPYANVEASADRSGMKETLSVETRQAGAEIVVPSPRGEVDLVWRRGAARTAEAPLLAVDGKLTYEISGEEKLNLALTAELTVRPQEGPLDSFEVELPPGASPAPSNEEPDEYEISPLERTGPRGGQLLRVRLSEPRQEPVVVQLQAQRSLTDPGDSPRLEIGAVLAPRALRQAGEINVSLSDAWSAEWSIPENVRRVSVEDQDDSGAETASFRYDSAPMALQVQLQPKRSIINVEPVYAVAVEERQVRLKALLRYSLRGASAQQLTVDVSDWTIDRVRPIGNASDSSNGATAAHDADATSAALPSGWSWRQSGDSLRVDLPAAPQVTLLIEASESIDPDEDEFTFPLLQPQASTVTPASLVVAPADNIRLQPRNGQMQALAVDPLPPALPAALALPPRQQPALYYREHGDAGRALFAAQFEVRPRSVAVEMRHRIHFGDDRTQVRQILAYRVDYEPLHRLLLRAPREAAQSGDLAILREGQPLPWTVVEEEIARDSADDADTNPSLSLIEVDLLGELQGRFELEARYSTKLAQPGDDETRIVAAPLIAPPATNELTVTGNHARVTADDDWSVEPPPEVELAPEAERESSSSPSSPTMMWRLPADAVEATAILKRTDRQQSGGPRVERAWLQTWLTPTQRQDRAVFRLEGDWDGLLLELPQTVTAEEVKVALDGEPVPWSLEGDRRLAVASSQAGEGRRVLEVWCWYPRTRERENGLRIGAPQIVGAKRAQRFFWQLALPRDEHVWLGPAGLTPEHTWRWSGLWWERRSGLEQEELEAWSGGSQQASLPSQVNRYLYSSFGTVPALRVRTASRGLLVLAAGGLTLALGLALLFAPVLRRPAVLMAAGVVVAGGAFLYPDVALLAAQAMVLGLLLVLVAQALRALAARRRRSRSVIRGSSRSTIERSTELQAPAEPPAEASTTLAASPLQMTGAESRS